MKIKTCYKFENCNQPQRCYLDKDNKLKQFFSQLKSTLRCLIIGHEDYAMLIKAGVSYHKSKDGWSILEINSTDFINVKCSCCKRKLIFPMIKEKLEVQDD